MSIRNENLAMAFAEVLQKLAVGELRPDVMQAAKERILDALAVTFDGLDEPASKVAFRSVNSSGGACTLIGRIASAAAADAAFVNAVACHATGQADCGGGGHPGTYVIPVALAVGEQRRRSGKEVLSAIAVGYEAAHRMAKAVGPAPHANGFRSVPTIGVFGAAASAAVLSGFDAGSLATALNFAANMAGGFYQCLVDGTIEAHIHAGQAARSGIYAADLAGAGGEASPFALDGPHGFFSIFTRGHYDGRALTSESEEIGVLCAWSKPSPACAVNQDTMLMIRSLQPVGFAASEIERVVLRRPAGGWNGLDTPGVINEPPYRNMIQAQMSAKFTAIAAVLGRPVTELSYFRESFRDPEVEQIAQKTTVIADQPSADAITVEVMLKSGRTVVMRSEDVAEMKSSMNIEATFERLASPRLHDATRSVLDVVKSLEDAPDIGRLMQLVRA